MAKNFIYSRIASTKNKPGAMAFIKVKKDILQKIIKSCKISKLPLAPETQHFVLLRT